MSPVGRLREFAIASLNKSIERHLKPEDLQHGVPDFRATSIAAMHFADTLRGCSTPPVSSPSHDCVLRSCRGTGSEPLKASPNCTLRGRSPTKRWPHEPAD